MSHLSTGFHVIPADPVRWDVASVRRLVKMRWGTTYSPPLVGYGGQSPHPCVPRPGILG